AGGGQEPRLLRHRAAGHRAGGEHVAARPQHVLRLVWPATPPRRHPGTAPRPRAGRRAAGTRPGTDTARPADPVTTPIRRQSYRAAPPPRRRAALAGTFPPPAPTDESSVDLLVSREKRRRGKHS